jgi:hypothetical protein
MKKLVLPKELLIPQIKGQLVTDLKDQMQKAGIKNFRFIDMEWAKEGIVVYYDDSNNNPS